MDGNSTLQLESLAYAVRDVCSLTRLSRAKIYDLIAGGHLRAVKCDRRTLILRDDLVEFLNSLPPLKSSRDC